MKLTEQQLKQLIQEELESVIDEGFFDFFKKSPPQKKQSGSKSSKPSKSSKTSKSSKNKPPVEKWWEKDLKPTKENYRKLKDLWQSLSLKNEDREKVYRKWQEVSKKLFPDQHKDKQWTKQSLKKP